METPAPPPRCPAPRLRLRRLCFENGLIARPERMKPLVALVQCGGAQISELALETAPCDPDVAFIDLEAGGGGVYTGRLRN